MLDSNTNLGVMTRINDTSSSKFVGGFLGGDLPDLNHASQEASDDALLQYEIRRPPSSSCIWDARVWDVMINVSANNSGEPRGYDLWHAPVLTDVAQRRGVDD